LAFTIFQTVFALFAQERLALDARATSYVLTYVGILIVAVQGGGIGWLTSRFSEKQLILGGTVLLCPSLLGWALTPAVWALLLVLIPLALSGGVLGVAINSALTKSVYPEEVGGTLGVSASLGSIARVVSPIVGGLLLDVAGAAAPGALGALLMGWCALFVWRRVLPVPDLVCPEPTLGDVP
jgi:MFS family permease